MRRMIAFVLLASLAGLFVGAQPVFAEDFKPKPAIEEHDLAPTSMEQDLVSVVDEQEALSNKETTALMTRYAERGLGEPDIVEVLYDHLGQPRYVLAESASGYLVWDRDSGIVMEWAEHPSPYHGYEGMMFYGGYGLYFVEQGDLFLNIRSQEAAVEIDYNSILDDIDPALVESLGAESSGGPAKTVPMVNKTLPNTYDYIQRLSFGNNDGTTYNNSCTAVACQIALNYLDNTVDKSIVPINYEAEQLAGIFWNTGYKKTEALFNHLLYDCDLAPQYFFNVTPGVWGLQVYYGINLYRNNTGGVASTGLYLEFREGLYIWDYVAAEIDKGLPAMITTWPGTTSYSAHSMVVCGYININNQQEFQVHNGWYGKNDITNNAHIIDHISSTQAALGYAFRVSPGWHINSMGQTKYYNADGSYLTGLQTINNKLYYFTYSGAMQTGWQWINNSQYYFGADGAAYTGTHFMNTTFYHFDQSGVLIDSNAFTYFTGPSPRIRRFSPESAQSMAFGIPGGSSTDGVTLQLAVAGTGNEQYFELIPTGETNSLGQAYSYYIRNATSGKVLMPSSSTPQQGSTIIQQTLNYSELQKWIFESVEVVGTTAYSWKIVPKVNVNLVIDSLSSSSPSGTVLQLRERNGSNTQVFRYNSSKYILTYRAHVQTIGWQAYVNDGATAGTSGQSLRVEALNIKVANFPDGSNAIQYNVHVQNYGWMGWVNNNALAGTTGQGLRVEAIQIKLTGEMASRYDIYYRVHVQNYGWMSWVSNGATAGTSGQGLRIEALEIRLVFKGAGLGTTSLAPPAPPDTLDSYTDGPAAPEAYGAGSASELDPAILPERQAGP